MRAIWAAVVVCLALAGASPPAELDAALGVGAGSTLCAGVGAGLDDGAAQLTRDTAAVAVAPRVRPARIPDRIAAAPAIVVRGFVLVAPRSAPIAAPLLDGAPLERARVHARSSRGPPPG